LINNRQQNGRRRGRGNNNQRPQGGNGGGGGRAHDNGNRIDNRSRGNAAQLLEKYKTLARDSQQAGDRVLTEYYLQFADHYFRVLADTRARYEENQPRREGGREARYDGDEQGFEGEEGFEGEQGDEFDMRPQQQSQPQRQERPQQARYDRDDRPERQDENGEQRARRDGQGRDGQGRDGQGRSEQPRDNQNRDYQDRRPNGSDRPQRDTQPRETQPREDAPRLDRNREDRPREDRPREARAPRVPRERTESVEAGIPATLGFELPPAIASAPTIESDEAPAPKRRGRPKKVVSEAVTEG